MREFCTGLLPYDKKTKKGNFKKVGKTCYIKRNQGWKWFLKIVSLTEFKDMRGADDVDCDTIIFDEYTTTPRKYRQYHGNIAEDFFDLVVTIARQHAIRAIFCGNKESIYNPFYAYLKLPPMPEGFEGIRYFKERSIVRQQFNTPCGNITQFKKQLSKALKNTPYGEYLFEARTRTQTGIKYYQAPKQAVYYEQFYVQDTPLKVVYYDRYFYIGCKADTTQYIYTDRLYPNLPRAKVYTPDIRLKYNALIQGFINNRIRYENGRAQEAAAVLSKMLKLNL